MKEKVVAAAIKFYIIDDSNERDQYATIMTAERHADVYDKMWAMQIRYDKQTAVQGFWTSNNRFVDRYEAKQIAVAADQLIVPESETCAELYSEDVW